MGNNQSKANNNLFDIEAKSFVSIVLIAGYLRQKIRSKSTLPNDAMIIIIKYFIKYSIFAFGTRSCGEFGNGRISSKNDYDGDGEESDDDYMMNPYSDDFDEKCGVQLLAEFSDTILYDENSYCLYQALNNYFILNKTGNKIYGSGIGFFNIKKEESKKLPELNGIQSIDKIKFMSNGVCASHTFIYC
eukprot:375563_1